MARLPRVKAENCGTVFYHLYARVAGIAGYYPLKDSEARNMMIWTIKHYSSLYKTRVAGFSIMGNHYHMVVEFQQFEKFSKDELKKIFYSFYGKKNRTYVMWDDKKWEKFNRRLFDVSEFMRNVQAKFACWFNDKNRRKGTFWGGRFKSTLLEDSKAMRNCLYYVELNSVRAGIVQRPEDFEGGSLFYREISKDGWMMPLKEVVPAKNRKTSLINYRAGIYYRGNVRTKANQKKIPDYIIKQEEANGFKARGVYGKRIRYFVDGVALGSSQFIDSHLKKLRSSNGYSQRKNPIETNEGNLNYLRPQRKSEIYIG